jgi:hypothetical protein
LANYSVKPLLLSFVLLYGAWVNLSLSDYSVPKLSNSPLQLLLFISGQPLLWWTHFGQPLKLLGALFSDEPLANTLSLYLDFL